MKILKPNIKGEITYCSSSEDKIGIGKCNHIKGYDIKQNESIKEYENRINNKLVELKENYIKNYRENNKISLKKNQKINPEFINGAQDKYKTKGYYIKIDEDGRYNGLAEEICSLFLDCCENIEEHANYKTKAFYEENNDCKKNCVVSNNFLKKNENTRNFNDLLTNDEFNYFKNINDPSIQFDYIISIIKNKTNLDYKKYLIQQMIIDLICINPDRHLKNLSIIEKEDEKYRICPIYDNGLGLLATLKHYPLSDSIENNINKVTYNPFGIYENEKLTSNKKLTRKEQINLVINKIGNNYDFKIKINKNKLLKILNNYHNYLYKDEYVNRAIESLKISLNQLEDILWIDNDVK